MGDEAAISEEEFANWIAPRDAMARLSHLSQTTARRQIAERLKADQLRAIARRITKNQQKYEFGEILPSHWRLKSDSLETSGFWHTGDITIVETAYDATGRREYSFAYFGVRFDPVGLDEFAPAPISAPSEPQAIPAPELPTILSTAKPIERRGRPPKEWWDDLWVEICRQIYVGDLQPKTQADIERAMLDWATSNEYEMGEATAKRAARKLIPIFRDEGSK